MKDNIEEIITKADFITTSSEKLYQIAKSQRKRRRTTKLTKQHIERSVQIGQDCSQKVNEGDNDEIFLVGNGVDFEHFAIRNNQRSVNNVIGTITGLVLTPPIIKISLLPIQ